jgi:septum formation protein
MSQPRFVLASSSETRLRLLRAAGLEVTCQAARIDEAAIRAGLEAEDASPQDIADLLAEMKAWKVAEKDPEAIVLGCDQVLEFNGKTWGKPETRAEALAQLCMLRGQKHLLLSALVLYHEGKPIWRHVGRARLTMHEFSDAWLTSYVDRNWGSIRHSAGGYLLEEEGVRLFSAVEGDYFTILGLPLLPLLGYLRTRGFIET